MRIFGNGDNEDLDPGREAAHMPLPAHARPARQALGALLLLAACAPCAAGAHTAGVPAVFDAMECVAHARMHPGTTPIRAHGVTYDLRGGGADDGTREHLPASASPDPEWPATGCEPDSDARPRMNPGRLAQPPGNLTAPVTQRQRVTPDDGAQAVGTCDACPKCLAARHVARTPLARAAATPLSRFERAARGPPASAVAPHR